MPLGENVGTAYVRLFVDGSGLDDQIRDEFDKSEPAYRDSARRNAKTYDAEFADYLEKKGVAGNSLRDSLTDGLKEADFTKDFFSGSKWEAQKKRIAKNFGTLAPTMIKDLEDQFQRQGTLDGLADALNNLNPAADRARRSLVRLASAEQAVISEDIATLLRKQADRLKEIDRDFADHTKNMLSDRAVNFRDIVNRLDQDGQAMRDFEAEWRKTTDAISKDGDKAFTDATRGVEEHGRALDRTLSAMKRYEGGLRNFFRDIRKVETELGEVPRGLARYSKSLDNVTDRIGTFSDGLGRAFGKGSRNDFLNIVGRMVGGMANLTSVFSRAGSAVTKLPAAFGKLFGTLDEAGKVTYSASSVAEGLALSLGGLAAAGAAGAVGLAVLGAVIGPLIGLMSGLAGIAAALASTLSFALVGAVGALAGAMLPLAAGIGVIVAGFVSLSDAQKDLLKINIKPVTDAFSKLGDTAAEVMTKRVGENAKRLGPVIESLNPLVRGLSNSIADIADSWTKSMSGPGFTRFIAVMTRELPGQLTQLGDIIGNTLGGIGGLFEGMIPITERFLGWLSGITQTFSDWANSASGQSQIVSFFDKAGDAASSLGGFLGDVWSLVSEIIGAGVGTGDTIFDKMGDAIGGWADYLKNNPDALGDWFANAEDTAGDLGDLITDIGGLIDKLDSDEAREAGNNLLSIVGGISSLAGVLAGKNDNNFVIELLNQDWGGAAKALLKSLFFIPIQLFNLGKTAAVALFNGLTGALSGAGGWISGVVSTIAGGFAQLPGLIVQALSGLGSIIAGVFSGVVGIAGRVVSGIVGFFAALPGRIASVIASLPGFFNGLLNTMLYQAGLVIGRIVGFFIRLPGRVRSAIAALPGQVVNIWNRVENTASNMIGDIVGFFRRLPGRVVGAIAGLAGQVAGVFSPIPGRIAGFLTSVVGYFRGLPGRILRAMGNIASTIAGAFDGIVDDIADIPGQIVDAFRGLGGDILSAIGSIDIGSLIKWPAGKAGKLARGFLDGVTARGGIFGMADGGVVRGPSVRLVGEAGPEAVVPLLRPLGSVDPAVRALSAYAQGKTDNTVTGRGGTTIEAGAITVITPASDARAVAYETLNYIAAAGY